jgi:hypothetical protein
MTDLQDVTVIFFLELVMPDTGYNGEYLPFQTYHPNREMPQSMFESFWATRKAENWANFYTLLDKYPQPYFSVKILRRRR